MNHIIFKGVRYSPSKIICVGRNYVEHIKELNNEVPSEPVIFIKPNSAIADEIYTYNQHDIHYEAEVSFLIQHNKITAVAFGLDLTKRSLQKELKQKGLPWERAKAFDRSAVFSEFVAFKNIANIHMELLINNEPVQHATYELMLNKPEDLLAEIQSFMSLEDNDVLMTGTPKGVGAIHSGDEFMGRIYENDQLLIEHCWRAKKCLGSE